jgi:UDP-N-acetyl-D-glucosamine/UDP-N-acetyl-D-galactosamine dehydrogenase
LRNNKFELDPVGASHARVVVVGLGYVGLPLAVALAGRFEVIGFDINAARVAELRNGKDRTGEIEPTLLEASSLTITSALRDCRGAAIYIVTVPTPIDENNEPDLRPLISASKSVGSLLEEGRNQIVVYESTVYPGVTEDVCGPLLEKASGLVSGRDFFLGYSPERINPGDREHTVERIVKVVAGQTPEVTACLAELYGAVITAGVFTAASIKSAEAAKVIENAQRDINIAFMNEVTQIFHMLDLSIWDVLDAARTKWNFLPFRPGLVGGHCIGVDPYYLSYRAQQLGFDPKVVLAGRTTNDGFGRWIAERVHAARGGKAGSVLVLGLTFKENVPDLRNSRAVDVIAGLEKLGHRVTVHDPLADPHEALEEYGIALDRGALERSYDMVLLTVPHRQYQELLGKAVRRLVDDGGCVADLSGAWRNLDFGPGIERWTL